MAMQNVFNILVDLKVAKTIPQPLVTQNDSVVFILEVMQDGVPFDLTDTTIISLAHTRKDQTVVVTPGTKVGNKATFALGTNETSVTGAVTAKAQFYDADGRVSTLSFSYQVGLDPTGSDYVPSETEQTLIQVVMADAQAKIDELSAVDVVELSQQLADKATKTELANVLNGSPKGTYATLAALQAAFPTGTTGVYIVTADGHIYSWSGSAWVSRGLYQAVGISNNSVTPDKTNFIQNIEPNLFDKTKAVVGLVVRADGTINTTFTSHRATDYMPVVAGQLYQAPGRLDSVYYDANKVYVSSIGGTTAAVTSPVTGFIRMTIPSSIIDTFMFTKNTVPPSYVEYGEQIQIKDPAFKKLLDKNIALYNQNNPVNYTTVSRWLSKKVLTIGDSITWYDGNVLGSTGVTCIGYQQVLKSRLGITFTNVGVSGQTMAKYPTWQTKSFMNTLTTHDYTQYDLITIALGTNDYGNGDGAAIGTFGNIADTTFNEATFYGAYRKAIEYILTAKPTAKLVLVTPLRRISEATANTAGHKLEEYVDAVIEIGRQYGLPVCDLYHNSGFNKVTLTALTIDGLHPNNPGHLEIGNYLTGFVSIL